MEGSVIFAPISCMNHIMTKCSHIFVSGSVKSFWVGFLGLIGVQVKGVPCVIKFGHYCPNDL